MNDERMIRELIEGWAAAVRRQDLGGILAHHAANIVMFDVPPPVVLRGLDAYRESWGPFFEAFSRGGTFEIADLEITSSDSVAFATALLRCETGQNDPAPSEPQLRLTVGLRKVDDCWTVVHEHHSFPQ
jgi:ketosteroid isomerase-like protein